MSSAPQDPHDVQAALHGPAIVLELKSLEDPFDPFLQLLQRGFLVTTAVGVPLKQVLLQLPGMSLDYLESRVQTIFLNGKAIDDLDRSLVEDGATVALSAAMPGLVGAMLRKGGKLSSLRSSISHCPTQGGSNVRQGKITLKLFNLLLRELGPKVLQCGIYLEMDTWRHFLKSHEESLASLVASASVNGTSTALPDLIAQAEKTLEKYCLLTAYVREDQG